MARTETIRKPKPKRAVQLFSNKRRNSDQKDVPTAFEQFCGTKPWTCHGCHEPLTGAFLLLPSERAGFSHDIYHRECDPRG